jgi:hypothetical protein
MHKGCNLFSILALNEKGVGEGIEHISMLSELQHRKENSTDSENALSDVDPRVTRLENAAEGVARLGIYMFKCITVWCTYYFHTK